MLEADFQLFDRAFKRLAGLFRLRLIGDKLDELSKSYFKILEGSELHDVLEAGKVCVATRRQFPKPIDWLEALPVPKRRDDDTLGTLSYPEAEEYQRAERLGFEDEPCDCVGCQLAGVTTKPLRFVPETISVDDHRERRVHDTIRNRIVVAGHWAHGQELARWWVARDHFFGLLFPAVATRTMPAVERDPGEDDQ